MKEDRERTTYPSHALTLVDFLAITISIKLSEKVEGNDSVDVDNNTCHKNSHCQLGEQEVGEERE